VHNPLAATKDTREDELSASMLFGESAAEELSTNVAPSIRARLQATLVATGRTAATPRRFALTSSALVAPLLLVGAASAATGTSPLEGPTTVLQVASSAIGIGGNSSDVRQDVEVRNTTASDTGQPGSQPGNTAHAPGLNSSSGGGDGESSAALEASDSSQPSSDTAEAAPEEKLPPHENGKGCDDVLFANGEPPFASPGGPAGCEVGNSADHRKNGAKQEDSDTTEPSADVPTDDATAEDEETPGGTSHGLGKGHDEDPPGTGIGYGHDKHDHEPNQNGKGPGGPNADETPQPDPAQTTSPEPGSGDSTAPGKSGAAPGKNKDK
jgi:hypothetical protein